MRISDWSSDVCSSDLPLKRRGFFLRRRRPLLLAERRELRVHRALKGRPCKTPVQIGLQPRLLGDQARFDTLAQHRRHRDVGDAERIDQILLVAHRVVRSEEHTSELQSLMRNSYAVFCLKKKKNTIANSNKIATI